MTCVDTLFCLCSRASAVLKEHHCVFVYAANSSVCCNGVRQARYHQNRCSGVLCNRKLNNTKSPTQWLLDLYLTICLQVGSEGVLFVNCQSPLGVLSALCSWKSQGLYLLRTAAAVNWFTCSFKGSGYSSRSRTGRDKYGPPVRTEYRLVVENLSSRCSWQDLKVHLESQITVGGGRVFKR